MSPEVTKEYLAYLDSLHISWIVCGEKHIDLHKAVEILYTEFGVEGPVTKMYFRAFASNFKKGIASGLIYTAVLAVLILDIQIWTTSQSQYKPMFVTATMILIALVVMAGCWLFPLLAKFENTTKNMLKNAVLFAFKYLPVSLSMGIVVTGYAVLVMEYIFSVWFLFIVFGVVLLAYPWTFYVRMRFEKYLEEQ